MSFSKTVPRREQFFIPAHHAANLPLDLARQTFCKFAEGSLYVEITAQYFSNFFVRQSRPGWANWGDQATKFDGGAN